MWNRLVSGEDEAPLESSISLYTWSSVINEDNELARIRLAAMDGATRVPLDGPHCVQVQLTLDHNLLIDIQRDGSEPASEIFP